MNHPASIQNVAWETGLQSIKDSANFESFDLFAQHLRDGIRQNSEVTRAKYASLIVKRLFPDRRLDGINTRAWRAYSDEKILADLARVTTLEAEPVIALFIVEQVLALEPGTVIETATVRDYISAVYGSFKPDSYNRLLTSVGHMGFIARSAGKFVVQSIPRPANAFLVLLHARLAPTPRIVRLSDILMPPTPINMDTNPPIVPFWRLLGIRDAGDVRSILRDADAARLIAKYAVVDQLEQITTRYSVDEYLAGAYRL